MYPESGRKQKWHSSKSWLFITTNAGTIKVSVKICLYEMYLPVQDILFLSRDEDILFVFYDAQCWSATARIVNGAKEFSSVLK